MKTILLITTPNGINACCADCQAVLMKDIPDARTAYFATGTLAQHVCQTGENIEMLVGVSGDLLALP